ncbi:hypothetical protein WICMUC_002046 [Wickerhamomyces mucosus]|uniref:Uncharacterized protein n=1 Tax=Wickerhamomyces mucosus TaxID=1378264 RepID=A0A9P8TF86_9ASCO|nr:hypothetical protein WICMUC_002046 [Wickerhamomyces mucosus]
MSSSLEQIRIINSQVLISTPLDSFNLPDKQDVLINNLLQYIVKGEFYKVFQDEQIAQVIKLLRPNLYDDDITFNQNLSIFVHKLVIELDNDQIALFIAIASLNLFIQNNFTGPSPPINSYEIFFGSSQFSKEEIQLQSFKSLSSYGQTAYQDSEDPIFLLLSLHLLEKLSQTSKSLLLNNLEDSEEFIEEETVNINDPFMAATKWWRSRAIQVQLSLYPEFSGPHIAVSSSIFNVSLPKALSEGLPEKLARDLSISFFLEKTKNSLESNLEHLALPNLIQAQKLTGFEFVLTGAKAKRTKYQQIAKSSLIVLAKSNYFNNKLNIEQEDVPENLDLNSELLLEKPHFEIIGEEDLEDQIYKKQKTDLQEIDYSQLLPVSLRQEYIPTTLQNLDPNSQPNLSDYDNIQLLLRLFTLRQTSPAGQELVNQQLMSLVSRVLYQTDSKFVNYSIFSRGLWERSILETTKARTIERGILQMQSLVEEIGLKIKTRYIPTEDTASSEKKLKISNSRLRYVFQLPLLPRWSLDTKLAEKYMSLGIVKSAIEIYERLNLDTEVALCYASIGEESKAKKIIEDRLAKFPDDARTLSILGDLTENPALWEKAWEIGKYSKAKVSLSKYYYSPPKGIDRNLLLAVQHIRDSLTINPINFDNWFFYGCLGLETENFELSAEAFTRCVSLDDANSNSWANLATSLLKLEKLEEAFKALKKAVATSDNKRSWRLWENYLIVAVKLSDWNEVLYACKRLTEFKDGENSVDIPIVEKLTEILITSDYNEENPTFFQKNCTEFITIKLPSIINSSARLWRIISKVELWRKKPWLALESNEKAYRAVLHNPELETTAEIWNEAVEACEDLVASYESLGELPGRLGAGDVVCKDWRYKAKSTIKSLMSKGRNSWDDSDGWERLNDLKSTL